MLYNPAADDRALISEFLAGFYGPGASAVAAYMMLVSQSFSDTGGVLQENVAPTMSYLTPSVVLQAISLIAAAANDASGVYATRLRTLWLSPTYVTLLRWDEFYSWAASNGVSWPLASTPQAAFASFSDAYNAAGMGSGALSEGGHGLAWLQAQLPPQ
jgi:hypothetical protein